MTFYVRVPATRTARFDNVADAEAYVTESLRTVHAHDVRVSGYHSAALHRARLDWALAATAFGHGIDVANGTPVDDVANGSTLRDQALRTLRDGGSTVPALPGRYVVALGKPAERVTDIDPEHVLAALEQLEQYRVDGRALGTWVHDGRVYVDVVESYDDIDAALARGREREQLAIYDTVTDQDVAVPE